MNSLSNINNYYLPNTLDGLDPFDASISESTANITTIINNEVADIGDQITVIEGDITIIQNNVSTVNNNITTINNEITTIEQNVNNNMTYITGIQGDITRIDNDITNINTDISEINTDITTIEQNVNNNMTYITGIQGDITRIDNDITNIEGNVNNNMTYITGIQGDITRIDNDITTIEGNINDNMTYITGIQGDITRIDNDITTIEGNLNNQMTYITGIQGDITRIDNDITTIEGNIATINTNITGIQGSLNNYVLKAGDTMTGVLNLNQATNSRNIVIKPRQENYGTGGGGSGTRYNYIRFNFNNADGSGPNGRQWCISAQNDDGTTNSNDLIWRCGSGGGDATRIIFGYNRNYFGQNVGIGTSSPSQLLDVNGSSIFRGALNMNTTNKIINLADGTNSADAVNKGQLDLKANISYVDSQDNLKADLTYVDANFATIATQIINVEGSIFNTQGALTNYIDATDTEISNINTNITNIQGNISLIEGDITAIEGNITTINANIATMATQIVNVEGSIFNTQGALTNYIDATDTEITNINTNITNIQGNIAIIEGDITTIEGNIATINTNITGIQGNFNNYVLKAGDTMTGGLNVNFTNAFIDIRATEETQDSILYLSTPYQNGSGRRKTAIIADGISSWNRANLHFCLNQAQTHNDVTISDSRMCILNGGNVGIGTTTPAQKLDVNGASIFRGALSMNTTNKIINLANGSNPGDAVNKGQLDLKADKSYVDTQDNLKADKTYVDSQDALKADITYVDTQDNLRVLKAGDTMTGSLSMNTTNKITNLANGTVPADAVNKGQLDLKADLSYVDTQDNLKADKTYTDNQLSLKVNRSGDNMTGSLSILNSTDYQLNLQSNITLPLFPIETTGTKYTHSNKTVGYIDITTTETNRDNSYMQLKVIQNNSILAVLRLDNNINALRPLNMNTTNKIINLADGESNKDAVNVSQLALKADKTYVDNKFVEIIGDTMTGSLIIDKDITNQSYKYVYDNFVNITSIISNVYVFNTTANITVRLPSINSGNNSMINRIAYIYHPNTQTINIIGIPFGAFNEKQINRNGIVYTDDLFFGVQTNIIKITGLATVGYYTVEFLSFGLPTINNDDYQLTLKSSQSSLNNTDLTGIRFNHGNNTDAGFLKLESTDFQSVNSMMSFQVRQNSNIITPLSVADNVVSYVDLNMSGNKVKNVANGTDPTDAINKSQLDLKANVSIVDGKVNKNGDTMTGSLSMNITNKITNLANGELSNDAVNKGQLDLKANISYVESNLALKADTAYVNSNDNLRVLKAGDTMAGSLTMNNVLNLNGGTVAGDAGVDFKTNTYIRFGEAGATTDWAYLRQIGGSAGGGGDIHLSIDFHDDFNDGKFSLRNVYSTVNPDEFRTFFSVSPTQAIITAPIIRSAWSSGELIQTKIYSQNIISGVKTITANSNGTSNYVDWFTASFTMKNPTPSNSTLVIEVNAPFLCNGGLADRIFSKLLDTTSNQTIVETGNMYINSAGGGARGGAFLPLIGSYIPTGTSTSRSVKIQFDNNSDDILYICRTYDRSGTIVDRNYYTIKVSEYCN